MPPDFPRCAPSKSHASLPTTSIFLLMKSTPKDGGRRDLVQWNLDSGFQSLVGFRIPSAVFQIPKPRIPHSATNSTSKNVLDSGIRISLHEAKKRKRKNNLSGAIYTAFQEDLYLLKRGYFQVQSIDRNGYRKSIEKSIRET